MTRTMTWNRTVAITIATLLVLGGLIYGFWPEATPVTFEPVVRDSLRVTVEEDGRTRLTDEYVLSAPSTGFLRRVSGDVGDDVGAGEVVARLATLPARVLDASDYDAGEARVDAARARLAAAREHAEGTEATRLHAQQDFERIRRIHEQGTASAAELDRARARLQTAEAEDAAAEQAVVQARHEVRAARSALVRRSPETSVLPTRAEITAPVDGRILNLHQESEGIVQAGTPLLTVGNPDSLEVLVEVLSADAVRLRAGMPVELIRWTGDGGPPLWGRVRTVSPQGETDVSALGVEEQRVPVVVDVTDPPSARVGLGGGYRVVARFILWEAADVLQVPQSALFRHEDGWATFVETGGRARLQRVAIGRRSGLRTQILDGVAEGERVITHPATDVFDGMRVEAR